MLAQMGAPDMHIPIAHALGWPERLVTDARRLDLTSLAKLEFSQPDPVRFPALRVAREVLAAGGAAPAIMNAANEVAVAAFLAHRIGFLDILGMVEAVLDRLGAPPAEDIESIIAFDAAARQAANAMIPSRAA
jgi:1-deoxy-D-xylulose-5-phosphate reductoisomerase